MDTQGPHSASRREKVNAIPISSTNNPMITMRCQKHAVLFINKESEKFKVTEGFPDSRGAPLSPEMEIVSVFDPSTEHDGEDSLKAQSTHNI
jgi:hypothetical protein